MWINRRRLLKQVLLEAFELLGLMRARVLSRNHAGVLVKYHPCTVYAREGSPCPFFKHGSKRCSKLPLSCEMPEYNKWFKDVLAGKIRSFYSPRRIYLFDISGVPLILYHSHEKKIVGEATVVKVTKENRLFHYWFKEFLLYPNFVDVTKIETDKSLRKMKGQGRMNMKYLTDRTVEEIRNLSGLPSQMKQKLTDELQIIKQEIAKMPKLREASHRGYDLALVKSKLKEIQLEHGINGIVLKKAYKIFLDAKEKGILKGRPTLDIIYASLYTGYRLLRTPITVKKMSGIYGLNPKKLFRDYRTLKRYLGLAVPRLSAKDFVRKYSERLPLSRETTEFAISLIETAEKSLSLQRSPRVVAAAAIHIASIKYDEPVPQKQIADVFEISSVSMRNCSRFLHPLSES